MHATATSDFNWRLFGAYRAFDGFIEEFIVKRKSYVTKHTQRLDLPAAFKDINDRFIGRFDAGDQSFNQKAANQFFDASDNSKIVFANVEYLWAMPSCVIKPETKREYAIRWFPDTIVNTGPDYYFWQDHGIANPGSFYQTNKYFEIVAILRLLNVLLDNSSTNEIKNSIISTCYEGIYGKPPPINGFSIDRYCGIHSALLHLTSPDNYEAIISKSHKESIVSVFEHVVQDHPEIKCPEEKIRLIKNRLYNRFGADSDTVEKRRSFFYLQDIQGKWIGKKKNSERESASIDNDIQDEQNAEDLSDEEGKKIPTRPGYRLQRSSKLVQEAKKRDNYECQACRFHFKNQIVHIHHLGPLAERKYPRTTTMEDLITLCPTCHHLAHYWLRRDSKYKNKVTLLLKLPRVK